MGSRLWVWTPSSTVRGRAFITELRGLGRDGDRKLIVGERFSRVPRLVAFADTRGRFVDNVGAYIGVHIVTPALADVLTSCAANVQLLPVSIAGQPKLRYFAVNVLASVALLDRKRSTLTVFPGTKVISHVSRLALKPVSADLPPIFHLTENPVLILVTDELRRALQAASRFPGTLEPAAAWRSYFG
jgi:hypothetical protein